MRRSLVIPLLLLLAGPLAAQEEAPDTNAPVKAKDVAWVVKVESGWSVYHQDAANLVMRNKTKFRVINLKTGTDRSTYEIKGEVMGKTADRLVVRLEIGPIAVLDLFSGEELQQIESAAAAELAGGSLYTQVKKKLRRFPLDDAVKGGKSTVQFKLDGTSGKRLGDFIISKVEVRKRPTIYCLDLRQGKVAWKKSVDGVRWTETKREATSSGRIIERQVPFIEYDEVREMSLQHGTLAIICRRALTNPRMQTGKDKHGFYAWLLDVEKGKNEKEVMFKALESDWSAQPKLEWLLDGDELLMVASFRSSKSQERRLVVYDRKGKVEMRTGYTKIDEVHAGAPGQMWIVQKPSYTIRRSLIVKRTDHKDKLKPLWETDDLLVASRGDNYLGVIGKLDGGSKAEPRQIVLRDGGSGKVKASHAIDYKGSLVVRQLGSMLIARPTSGKQLKVFDAKDLSVLADVDLPAKVRKVHLIDGGLLIELDAYGWGKLKVRGTLLPSDPDFLTLKEQAKQREREERERKKREAKRE